MSIEEKDMDDEIYLQQMELEYSLLNKMNNSIEQKAYAIIGVIGVIFTIQSSIIINLYPFNCYGCYNNLLLIIFIGSVCCYGLSIWFF